MINVVVFKGDSRYSALDLFIDRFAAGLQAQGAGVDVIDFTGPNPLEALQAIISCKKVEIFFAFNGLYSHMKAGDGRSLFDALGALYFSIYVDHPLTHHARIAASPKNSVMTFIDKSHVKWAERFLPKGSYAGLAFLPHGGAEGADAPLAGATKDFMFAGTCPELSGFAWRKAGLDTNLVRVVDTVYEHMNNVSECPIEDAVEASLRKLEFHPDAELVMEIQKVCFHYVNTQRTARNRLSLLDAMAARGAKVDIYGSEGWAAYASERPNITYKGQVTLAETLDLMPGYKFVLNDNNDFNDGSHERTFNSLINGAIPVIPNNGYYRPQPHVQDLAVLYDRETLAGLPETVDAFHNHYDERIDALRNNRDTLMSEMSWGRRAQEALSIVASLAG